MASRSAVARERIDASSSDDMSGALSEKPFARAMELVAGPSNNNVRIS